MIKSLQLIFFLLLIQITFCTNAQHHTYLSLEKKGRLRKIKYYPGEYLKLRFVGERRFYERKIIDLQAPYIIFDDSRINIKEIAEIDIALKQEKPPFLDGLGKYLPIAGVGYFSVDMINRTIVNDQPISIDEKVLRTSLIMIGTGYLFKIIGRKKFKIKPGRRLKVVNLKSIKN